MSPAVRHLLFRAGPAAGLRKDPDLSSAPSVPAAGGLLSVLDGEGKPSHAVLAQADHAYLVAQRQDIFDMLDAVRGDLGDVDHALFAGSELYECAELLDTDDDAVEDLSFFKFGRDDLDHALGFIHALLLTAADRNAAVIIDIDLDACALDDLIDSLAALADDITDLLRIDLHEVDLGSVLIDSGTGLGNGIVHNAVHDEHSGFTAARDGTGDDVLCQAVDLDIHLDRGDTVFCAGHLEVHVAEEVFKALDVGEENEIIVSLAGDKAAADACDGLLDRDTCCHKGHAGSAGGSHGCGTIGFEGLGDRTDRIRELINGGEHRHESTLSQCAVSDLAASGASGDPGLAYGIGREVVMMDIALLSDVGGETLDALCLGQRSQSDNVTDLGLSAVNMALPCTRGMMSTSAARGRI